jgi:hypothetical protein
VVEHDAQRCVAWIAAPLVRTEQVEATFQVGGNLGAREGAHPRSRQLDAERHPLDKLADTAHSGHILRRQRKLMIDPLGPVEKEQRGGRGARVGIARWRRQPIKGVDPLTRQAEPLPRGGEQRGARGFRWQMSTGGLTTLI